MLVYDVNVYIYIMIYIYTQTTNRQLVITDRGRGVYDELFFIMGLVTTDDWLFTDD